MYIINYIYMDTGHTNKVWGLAFLTRKGEREREEEGKEVGTEEESERRESEE